MARPKPMLIAAPSPHPFVKAFPRLSTTILFIAAVIRLAGALVRLSWPWRRELLAATVLGALWTLFGYWLPSSWALAATVGLVLVVVVTARPVRRWVFGWLRCSRTRRQVMAGLAETRAANPSGRLPRITRMRTTAVGECLVVVAKPGQSAELLDARVEELRAAARCREVRITRDENRSHRITFDIVRRDPLGATIEFA